jgi:hypothetical protein
MLRLPPLPPGEWTGGYCGPSMMRILGSYYGIERSLQEWSDLCNVTPPGGFGSPTDGCDPEQLIEGGRKAGLEGFVKYHTSIKELGHYIRQGIPPIVDWFTGDFSYKSEEGFIEMDGPDGHYSLVVAADATQLILRDPRCTELLRFNTPDFERAWFDFDANILKDDCSNMGLRMMVIIYPREKNVLLYE